MTHAKSLRSIAADIIVRMDALWDMDGPPNDVKIGQRDIIMRSLAGVFNTAADCCSDEISDELREASYIFSQETFG